MSKIKKRNSNVAKRALPTGWTTSDADEIERRRLRGVNEAMRIQSQSPQAAFFGLYRIDSGDGHSYRVEIRSLTALINSCDCPDHRVNGLGTCKHIEATLCQLQHRRKRAYREAASKGSPCIEIFLDRRDDQIRICWPGTGNVQGSFNAAGAGMRSSGKPRSRAWALLAPFFTCDNILAGDALDRLPALERAINASHATLRRNIRVSKELTAWLEIMDSRAQQRRARQHFEAEVSAGKASLDLLKYPLYPYQQEGMLHLAFTGRSLLADEMGLGKTVQAIAACELLRRSGSIRSVLVISPASLKGEWEEQIAKFSELSSQIIQGPRARRLRQYAAPAFFNLASYEQIRVDVTDINASLAPDVIILDEAQRIKNWRTKTAMSVKQLHSRYAFVLTGTPLENRIDEIYSITQFLDQSLFGPLFRFNRDFHQLDEKGRAIGYKNLHQLHARLRPIMLRRRKQDVEGQLPERTINTYFVAMHKEQVLRYAEYEARVARIAAMAKRRPLTKEEQERLQQYLACMRMLCDTPYILDPECRISPKLKELGSILEEITAEGDHKIIIFSEWERMLYLVRQLAEKMGLGYALHTGKIPQPERREEIRRFKNDAECRLFLSTDSGSLGLNLQVADVVINLDIPWNPARLEQRIARAWRKHQKRPVQVINLVATGSIEHRMLSLLEQKRALAEGVIDGKGEDSMQLPSGRAAFLDRIDALLGPTTLSPRPAATDPMERLCDQMLSRWRAQLELIELYGDAGQQTLLVVANRLDEDMQNAIERQLQQLFPEDRPQLQILDQRAYASVQQLIQAGVLHTDRESAVTVYCADTAKNTEADAQSARRAEACTRFAGSERKRRMAKVLVAGGFAIEALVPMREAVDISLQALAHWQGHNGDTAPTVDVIAATLVQTKLLPRATLSLVGHLREDPPTQDATQAENLLRQSDHIFAKARAILGVKKEPAQ